MIKKASDLTNKEIVGKYIVIEYHDNRPNVVGKIVKASGNDYMSTRLIEFKAIAEYPESKFMSKKGVHWVLLYPNDMTYNDLGQAKIMAILK